MSGVDAEWFKDRLAIKKLTQRDFGKLLGMDPSSVSLMLKGKRSIQIDRAAHMARILGVSLEEVCQRSGIGDVAAVGDRIPLMGHIDGQSRVNIKDEPTGWTISPGNLPHGALALVMRTTQTSLDMLNGWTCFAGAQDENVVEAVDRTALVKVKGLANPVLRLIRRGAEPGFYTLTGIGQEPLHDVQIDWIRPVLLFRPL